MRMKKRGNAYGNPLCIEKNKSALTESEPVSKWVVDFQNISPVLLHYSRATITEMDGGSSRMRRWSRNRRRPRRACGNRPPCCCSRCQCSRLLKSHIPQPPGMQLYLHQPQLRRKRLLIQTETGPPSDIWLRPAGRSRPPLFISFLSSRRPARI